MTRYPRGITQTPAGWRITVRRGGVLYQRRFPPATPIEDVAAELAKAKARHFAGRVPASGTFAADIARYLTDYFAGHAGHDERERHLQLWRDALGADRARATVTRDEISRILTAWRAGGLAAETCNKRRTALLALYHALDGKGGSNPVREIAKFRAPDPLPRGLPYKKIETALRHLPICKTRARLAVMAYTGIRHGQLMKLTADSWDRRTHVLTVPGTGKGRGTKPYALPLSSAAESALKLLDRLDGWGTFSWAPMARMWKVAAKKAKLPASSVPYDLRHSFGTLIFQMTGDLKTTKELLGHSSLRTTERYMLAAVPLRSRMAVDKAFGRMTVPTSVAKKKDNASNLRGRAIVR